MKNLFRVTVLAVIGAVTTLELKPQSELRSADDIGVYEAVLTSIRAQVPLRRSTGGTIDIQPPAPILTSDRTLRMCRPETNEFQCGFADNIDAFEGVSKKFRLNLFEKHLIPARRTELAAAYRARNREPQPFPGIKLEGVVVVPDGDLAAFDREWSRSRGSASFSLPAYSSDGLALVYGSYYCGNLCAYGWFYLLERRDGIWRVLDSATLWMS